MSKHEKYTRLKRQIALCLITGVALFSAAPMAYAATSVVANTALPNQGNNLNPNHTITSANNAMNIVQNGSTGVIKWESFDVGGSATVNFSAVNNGQDISGYHTLNYVNGGNMSQIYGTINAKNDGNIYIVNPAGVQIGNSAQINVGSLYVSTKYLDESQFGNFQGGDLSALYDRSKEPSNAELMSLGNINAKTVTFEGDGRIVIDTERIKDAAGKEKLEWKNIQIMTNNENNVIVGYKAYDKENKTYENASGDGAGNEIATVNGNAFYKNDGYMWVEDVEQLQAIDTNLQGNYALRNSIDATSTEQNEFRSIGSYNGSYNNAFSGKFDGIKYNIFGLTINADSKNNIGLFGVTDRAVINNVTLVGGKITGGNNVGAIVGNANNTTITNVVNSAAIEGNANVGGLVGSATFSTIIDAVNTGAVTSSGGQVESDETTSNAGGLVGFMYQSKLYGNSYNLGNVEGKQQNVGGLVGHAINSIIGDGEHLVYNVLDVTGAYNVGGIVGNMEGSTVQNAENSGNVTVIGKTTEIYSYHTADETYDTMGGSAKDGKAEVEVYVANVGGIAGISSDSSTIQQVTNTGDVDGGKQDGNAFYDAGNVGGIVGKATDTNILNATNRENTIRGAHNVGGVAGYFGGAGRITTGVNDGGDIQATGARAVINSSHNVNMTNTTIPGNTDTYFHDGNVHDGYAWEHVRNGNTGVESAIIGNMGGVVGYMAGDDVFITSSANRGTVHTAAFEASNVPNYAKAANVGGIVGKIDRTDTAKFDEFKDNYVNAAVSNSYNTGNVSGYTGVGGVVGMMYNGEIAGSYNLGAINTTRQPVAGADSYDTVNMGGIVGDTTENAEAFVRLYDVYNKGQIGDQNYQYYARHVGGVVGRLSGEVDKAYNTGAIYNGYNVVGGIAGWFATGTITNSFNTGNITVVNKENTVAGSQVGGIAGGATTASTSIRNAYNLGTLRSFQKTANGVNRIGGIVGAFIGNGTAQISNVYTTGNLYAQDNSNDSTEVGLGGIYGDSQYNINDTKIQNAYYIKPTSNEFSSLDTSNQNGTAIEYNDRFKEDSYHGFGFANQQDNGQVDEENGAWRIYEGSSLPILNAFLPNTEKYFTDNGLVDKNGKGGFEVQYGTAYDPLLTIIRADNNVNNLTFDWLELGVHNAAGFAVYGSGLTIDNFMSTGGSGYFGGLLYSDGALVINAKQSEDVNITGDISLGSSSKLYGSSVNLNADGAVTIYGEVTATGNIGNGATLDKDDDTKAYENATGEIKINVGKVDIYGKLNANTNNTSIKIPGIDSMAEAFEPGNVGDANAVMQDIGERFAYETVGAKDGVTGNISITTTDEKDGHVNLYFGNKEEGLITAGGNLTVNATGDVYVDSDLSVGGDLTLESSGEISEVLLDITNIGQVQGTNALEGLDAFLNHFQQGGANSITLTANSNDAKITVDMWDYENNQFDLNKFKYGGKTLADRLNSLNATATIDGGMSSNAAKEFTYIWVNNIEQQQGIQEYAKTNNDFLTYNFALKDDVNASKAQNYKAIGTDIDGYTGKFDGRGNRIIGLNTTGENAGIFSQIGKDGIVKNVNIYSSNFTGTETAGAIAGVNEGRIESVYTFGNTVQIGDTTTNGGNAGGIVGINKGDGSFEKLEDVGDSVPVRLNGSGLFDVESTGIVKGGANNAVVGGLVGKNEGALGYSFSNSAVTGAPTSNGFGGVVGHNTGSVWYVDSLGVTNGGTQGSNNVGGVIGTNEGDLNSAYNESIVSGYQYVGGIIGSNSNTSTLTNAVNAAAVTGRDQEPQAISKYVGGLIGSNGGNVTNGRNNGEITGNQYVGGLVGSNEAGSTLTNLVNDSSASITGEWYVGGIAGSNAGTITATNEDAGDEEDDSKLINRGTITGQQYVGGVAGLNTGTISNTNNDISLNVRHEGQTAEYFGGVAGQNKGTITNATNEANIEAEKANYVGGIVGHNAESGVLSGMGNSNEGHVVGNQYVGGVIGKNEGTIGESGKVTTVVNAGTVEALEGGAGGIVAYNNGDIINTKLTNAGNVSSKLDVEEAGTGGIFGYNEGDITGSVLENVKGFVISEGKTSDGHVSGTVNVGGLIGYNKGDITESTLRNEADITIEPKTGETAQNIGGLIGKNEGKITGGRNEETSTVDADSYYKYQIYNNGTITVTGEGENVGGLIGYNAVNTDANRKGSLDAAYNTGAIVANNSQNVGGLVGNNEGTVSQVFNTVLGKTDPISGNINVGGLIGTNSGSLDNAYNTTGVSGHNAVGNAVGVNAGTVTNVLDVTNTDNTLIGDNQGQVTGSYTSSLVEANGSQGITYISEEGKLAQNSYGSLTDDGTWRFYDGYSTPLLKVFLTTLKVDGDNVDITYNAGEQDLNIGQLVHDKVITAPNAEAAGPHDAFDGFAAYDNTKKEDGLGESPLLDNTTGQKNAGRYDNWLFSQQIAASGDGDSFNPNNLGYDIVYTNDKGIEVKKATLDIVLDDISRVYGSGTIQNSTVGSIRNDQGYGYTFDSEMTEEMKKELADSLKFTVTDDGAINNLEPGKTNNVGDDYKWSAQFTLTDDLGENYQFAGGSTLTGNSSVTKADLYIQANDENIALGGTPNFTGSVNQFVNGDSFNVSFGTDKDWTSTAGRYEGVIGFWGDDGNFYNASGFISDTFFGGNYNVYFTPGTLTVGTMPDIPAWEFPGGRWDYLYNDAPFDRNRDFRERKAEINFVDGGMEI